MADREMVLEGFFNMTDINFLVIDPQKNPLKEISPIDKPIDNCNFSIILFLSRFAYRFSIRINFSDGFPLYP